jgi:DNA-binding FadR family transcriptional regulator
MMYTGAMNGEDLFAAQEKRPSAVDVVVDSIKQLLIEKKLSPNEIIPSEQVLAERLMVSRGSVREAMKILSAFGIVEIKRGDGTYISNASNKKLFDPLLFQILVQDSDYQALIEMRHLLEVGIVQLLVRKASDGEMLILKSILEEFERLRLVPGIAAAEINAVDLKYHQYMGKFSHNPILESIYAFVYELFFPTMNSLPGSVIDVHRRLQAALERRDKEAAVTAIDLHTRIWTETALKKR